MEQPIFETKPKIVQWGLLLNAFIIAPLVGSAGMVLLVPMYAPLYPAEYQSPAALDDLTGTAILWYLAIVCAGTVLGMLRFRRQRFRLFSDRIEVETGAFLGRKLRVYPLADLRRIGARRSLLSFGKYGVVTIRARRRRKAVWKGVLGYREFTSAIAAAMPEPTPRTA